jgi:hypothetical protein
MTEKRWEDGPDDRLGLQYVFFGTLLIYLLTRCFFSRLTTATTTTNNGWLATTTENDRRMAQTMPQLASSGPSVCFFLVLHVLTRFFLGSTTTMMLNADHNR